MAQCLKNCCVDADAVFVLQFSQSSGGLCVRACVCLLGGSIQYVLPVLETELPHL